MAPPQSMDPGIVPQLQNIVSTVSLGCKLDLKKIALSARNAEYNPKRFAAVIMRIREPRTTALIFRYNREKRPPKNVWLGHRFNSVFRKALIKFFRH